MWHSTKWIKSNVNIPYVFVGNRCIGLVSQHFIKWDGLNVSPQHVWLEKYLTVSVTQYRNHRMKFQVCNPQTRSSLKISLKKDQFFQTKILKCRGRSRTLTATNIPSYLWHYNGQKSLTNMTKGSTSHTPCVLYASLKQLVCHITWL